MAPPRAHAAAFAAFASSIRSLTIAAAVAALRLGGADAWAQTADSTGVLIVHLRSTEGAVSFAQVRAGRALTLTNPEGVAVLRLRAGLQRIVVSKLGFRPDTVNLRMEAGRFTVLNLSITEQATELEAIIVTATRTGRHIEDEPVRVEILVGEDIEEKTPTRPQDLTNFVSEMSGIRIQQTAPGRGGAAIRIQGLRGQYTQVLSDGLPLAGSVSPGLILLQMPPLDLTQVEVIKGAATALYGPAALGGVMNLVSRRPDDLTEVLVSGRAPAGGDVFLWTSRLFSDRVGYTLIADAHDQAARDVDGDGWMDLPGYRRVGVRPRLFWNGERGASLFGTLGVMIENRDGGTVSGRTAPDGRPFDDGVDTRRVDGGATGRLPLRGMVALGVRAAGSLRRQIQRFGAARESGRLGTLFGEATLSAAGAPLDGLVGLAWQRDSYRADQLPQHDFTFMTPSVFGQGTYGPVRWLAASASGRCDAHSVYGTMCSPRVSLLLRPPGEWRVRLSGGTGFFAPTPFNEQTEVTGLTPLRPVSGLVAERGRNVSLDVSGDIAEKVEVTLTLFASEIRHPATVRASAATAPGAPPLELVNAPGPARAAGGEMFVVYEGHPIAATAYYAYLHATVADSTSGARREAALNPRHNVFLDVSWSDRAGLRIEVEANWIGRQALDDDPYRTVSREYANLELLVSKRVGRAMAWLSVGNLTDVRQSRYAPLLRPSRSPGEGWTVGQWGPVEGRVANAGLRVQH